MTLLEECLLALGEEGVVLPQNDKERITEEFFSMFPLTSWGRIDWSKISASKKVHSFEEIMTFLQVNPEEISQATYIIWDNVEAPVVKTSLHKVLQEIDEVLPVSFDTWIYCREFGSVIEFYHEGEVTVGIADRISQQL